MLRYVLALGLFLGVACMGGEKDPVTDPTEDDTGADPNVEFEGDDAGECEDGADNDRDGAFDCDDADCDGSPACDTGSDAGDDSSAPTVTYNVILDGLVRVDGPPVECTGESTLVADWEAGTIEGSLSCRLAEGDLTISGDFDGSIGGSEFDGIWYPRAGASTLDVVITGDASYGTLDAEVLFSSVVTFEGSLHGEAR